MDVLFKKTVSSCGKEKEFEVRRLSLNLYEAHSGYFFLQLWKTADSWKGSTNFFCEETIQAVGKTIDDYISGAN